MLKIALIVGTRPEVIKMAPIAMAVRETPGMRPLLVLTAQHREMSDDVLKVFSLKPDYDLDIMKPNQSLFTVTERLVRKLEAVLREERPDMVLVQGDTTSTFVGSLCSYYLRIPVGHVEAGLRTYDKYSPFPEEVNRKLTTGLSDLHFAPTDVARGSWQNIRDVPMVFIDRKPDNGGVDFVGIDNAGSAAEMTQYLYDRGARNIAFIGYMDRNYTQRERKRGFKTVLLEHGVFRKDNLVQIDYHQLSESDEIVEILRRTDRPEAILCGSCNICYEVLCAAEQEGLVMPRDLSVASCDDNQWFRLTRYPVPAVSHPTAHIAVVATKLLTNKIERHTGGIDGGLDLPKDVILPHELAGGRVA